MFMNRALEDPSQTCWCTATVLLSKFVSFGLAQSSEVSSQALQVRAGLIDDVAWCITQRLDSPPPGLTMWDRMSPNSATCAVTPSLMVSKAPSYDGAPESRRSFRSKSIGRSVDDAAFDLRGLVQLSNASHNRSARRPDQRTRKAARGNGPFQGAKWIACWSFEIRRNSILALTCVKFQAPRARDHHAVPRIVSVASFRQRTSPPQE